MPSCVWLRAETKAFERRTPLTPHDAGKLIQRGVKVIVESFPERIFPDKDYEEVGCKIVQGHTWPEAPTEALILGLKELPQDDSKLVHSHVYFAHAYKGQEGAQQLLNRFKRGGGHLYDLEYLTDDDGRRVCAFGKWAGYVGAALAVDLYYHQQLYSSSPYPALTAFPEKKLLLDKLLEKKNIAKTHPKALVIGALGRCGKGALELFESMELDVTPWDLEETKKGGPFKEIIQHDIFVNTVLVSQKIPPFLDQKTLDQNERPSVICDVSCDPTSEVNPLPIYSELTSWEKPNQEIPTQGGKVQLISVDNLPSLLPKESSEDFSSQLLPHLVELMTDKKFPNVWRNSFEYFQKAFS